MSVRHAAAVCFALTTIVAGEAAAANGPDLRTSIAAPAGVHVYESGRYTVTVSNTGNREATGVQVTIDLPSSQTSPQVYVMGTLGARSAGCTLSGLRLTCSVGRLRSNRSASVWFDLALPASAAPLNIVSNASGSPADINPGNNQATLAASLLPYALDVEAALQNANGSLVVDNDHCTGTGLVSYFQCTLFPSSISSHEATFHAGGAITFSDAAYSGQWSQGPSHTDLTFTYFEYGTPVAQFSGVGVDGTNCFEGVTTFLPASAYNSAYFVCLR